MRRAGLFLLLAFFLPAFAAPVPESDMTRPSAFALRPHLLALDAAGPALELALLDLDAVGDGGTVAVSWDFLALGLSRAGDASRWNLSAGTRCGESFVAGVSLLALSGGGATDLAATIGLGWIFDTHFLAECRIENIVLSPTAGGRIAPQYSFGAVLGAPDAVCGLDVSLNLAVDSDRPGFAAGGVLRPLSGMALTFGWSRARDEDRFTVAVDLAFDSARVRGGLDIGCGRTRKTAAVIVGRQEAGNLFDLGQRCLEITIAGGMDDESSPSSLLLGQSARPGFAALLLALERAARDDRIAAVLVHVRANSLGYARSEELLTGLARLKQSGRKIVAVLESASLRNLMSVAVADLVVLHPSAQFPTAGAAMTVNFYQRLLQKIGLEAELFHRGRYKSAAESVLRDTISEPHREAAERLLDVCTRRMTALIATNRRVAPERVDVWRREGLVTPDRAREFGIVDRIATWQDVRRELATVGLSGVGLAGYLEPDAGFARAPALAVIHVGGTIVNGGGGQPTLPFGERAAGADSVVNALQSASADASVAGIVVRVQSGGGDVLASARMREAVIAASRCKPLVVSMADVAASGGYYLACGDAANRVLIDAGAMTITGSIGVITGKLVTAGLRETIGVTTIRLGDTNAHIYGDDRKFSAGEKAAVVRMLDYWYEQFLSVVATARRRKVEDVRAVAEGRVWAGLDAASRGLVDRTAGFIASLRLVADRSGLDVSRCRLVELPRPGASLLRVLSGATASVQDALTALNDADAWPGALFCGRPLAMLPYNLSLD